MNDREFRDWINALRGIRLTEEQGHKIYAALRDTTLADPPNIRYYDGLTFDDYQERSNKTNRGVPNSVRDHGLMYYTLALCGETGELAEKVKKLFRDDEGDLTPERRTAALLECGDVLWYLSRIAERLNSSLEELANMNTAKLKDRMARGKTGGEGDER